jgi:EmrB/QacA subfamily drug resistance transporter
MPEPRRTPILLIILASYLMLVLDISIVITALPKMRETLGFSTTGLSWVENGYTLAFGGLLLLGARAGDLLGRRRVFIAGIGIFAVASLACGLAISAAVLVIARAVQGIGAAIAAPATLALLTANFPEGRERTRALACYGAVAGGGTAVGLVLGGILTEWLSWRSGMFINIPIGAALIVAARRYVPETPRHAGRFDLAGAATATLGMTSLVYGIVRSTQVGWTDRLTLAAVVAGSALLMLFALNEARAKQPITPLRLFASGERTGAYLARFLFIGANFSFLFFCTLFLQGTRHAGPLVAGLAFLPVAIPSFLTGVALPPIAHRFGNAQVLAVAVTLALTGMAWLSRLSADSPYLTGIALPMLLIGVGQGAAFGPLTAAGVAGAPNDDAGAAAGLVNRPSAGRQPRPQHPRHRLCRSRLSGPERRRAPRTPRRSWAYRRHRDARTGPPAGGGVDHPGRTTPQGKPWCRVKLLEREDARAGAPASAHLRRRPRSVPLGPHDVVQLVEGDRRQRGTLRERRLHRGLEPRLEIGLRVPHLCHPPAAGARAVPVDDEPFRARDLVEHRPHAVDHLLRPAWNLRRHQDCHLFSFDRSSVSDHVTAATPGTREPLRGSTSDRPAPQESTTPRFRRAASRRGARPRGGGG